MKNAAALGKAFRAGFLFWLGSRFNAMAMDKKPEKWITIKGNHIPLDKDGSPMSKAGKEILTGEKRTAKSFPCDGKDLTTVKPRKSTAYYLKKNNGNYRKAIVDFYDNELRGGYVDTKLEVGGKDVQARVVFDGKGRNEFQKFVKDYRKILEVLPHLPQIIKEGSYPGRKEEKNHLPQIAFHTKMKRVLTNGKRVLVAIDIGEDAQLNFHAYSVNREGIETFPKKKEIFQARMRAKKQKKIGQDSALLPSSKDSVIFLRRTSESNDRFAELMLTQDSNVVNMRFIGVRIM